MTERDRQADFDWLYGRNGAGQPPVSRPNPTSANSASKGKNASQGASSKPARPRIVGQPYAADPAEVDQEALDQAWLNWASPQPAQNISEPAQSDAPAIMPDQNYRAGQQQHQAAAKPRPQMPTNVAPRPQMPTQLGARPDAQPPQHFAQVGYADSQYASYPDASYAGYEYAAEQAPKKKRRKLHIFRWLFVILLAWLVFMIATPIHAWQQMKVIDDHPLADPPPAGPGTTILLVGTDSREHLSEAERQRLGTGDAAGSRADTMILLYRPPKGASVLISLPRDSYVDIPGYGKNKLNAAYAFGGPSLLVTTIEQATGLHIDGYLEIGFGGFAGLVDAVGGIDVCLKEPMKDEYAHIDLPAGCQLLNGANALGYVRMRYHDPRGDIGRGERQREVIAKVVKKASEPSTLLNPVTYWNLTHAGTKVLTRGSNTSMFTVAMGALAVYDAAKPEGMSLVVPIANPAGWAPNGASVVIWDDAAAKEMFSDIRAGDTSKLEKFRK